MNLKTKQQINTRFLLLYFFLYALIGWLLETGYSFLILGHFTKRGFLFGPLCPIYGFGAIILISILYRYKSKPVKLFIYSGIVFSFFEYVAGFALDALFAERWWDYTNDFLNLNGRISLFYSFAWGIIALIFLHFIHPFVEKYTKKLLKKIPSFVQLLFLQTASTVLVLDFTLSSIRYLHLF